MTNLDSLPKVPVPDPAHEHSVYHTLELLCANGHRDLLTIEGVSREWVEVYCGIVDGTSPLYKHPPGPESSIGKCGICGVPFKARVVDGR